MRGVKLSKCLINFIQSVKSFNDVFCDLVDFGRYNGLSSFLPMRR